MATNGATHAAPAPPPAQRVAVGGAVLRALHAALLDAFTLDSLKQLFLLELNRPLDTVVATEGRTLDAVVTDALRWALSAPGVGLHGLLDAARRANPASPALAQLAQEWRGVTFVRPACPYPGMRPFGEEERARFFGRAPEVQRALAALRLHPLLAVIGPSGSGKSSLAFAGIVPALRASTLFPGVRWTVAAMRPGTAPADTLAAALEDVERDSSRLLSPGAERDESRSTGEARLLLVVDQLEELFTLAGAEQRRAFEDALPALAQQPGTAILLTVRSDYYTDLLTSRLWPALRERLLDVAPLRGDALRDAIVQPAADVGVTVDPALAERLLADAGDEAGVLPFIQETMVLLWDQAEGFALTLDAYAAAVGARTGHSALQVALGGRADAAYLALDEEGQRLARRTFLRLIQFGEGRPDVRRQQHAADLAAGRDDPAALARVLDHLVGARLLTAGSNPAGERTYDLAHEALLTGWARLAAWARERREAETARRRLEEKAAEWMRLGAGEGGLLDAAELAEAEEFLRSPDAADLGVSAGLERLIAASRRAINPGWQPRGALLLAGAAVSAALWLAAVSINTFMLERNVRAAVWMAVGALAAIGIGVAALVARRTSYPVQRLTQWVVRGWTPRVALGGLLVANAAALVWLAPVVTRVQFCQAPPRSFTYPFGQDINVALINEGFGSYYAALVQEVLANAPGVRAWLAAPAEVEECRPYFDAVVRLVAEPTTDEEVAYRAEIEGAGNASAPEVFEEGCGNLGILAYGILSRLQPESGIVVNTALTETMPSCAAWQHNLEGYQALERNDYATALRELEAAVALQPDYAIAQHNIGLAYLRTGAYAAAVEQFQKALDLRPGDPVALKNLGLAYFYQGEVAQAQARFETLVADNPHYVPGLAGLANLLVQATEEYTRAGALLDDAAQVIETPGLVPPEHQNLYRSLVLYNRGLLALTTSDDPAPGIALMEQADALHDTYDIEFLGDLGLAYYYAGRTADACAAFARFEALHVEREAAPPDWLAETAELCAGQ